MASCADKSDPLTGLTGPCFGDRTRATSRSAQGTSHGCMEGMLGVHVAESIALQQEDQQKAGLGPGIGEDLADELSKLTRK